MTAVTLFSDESKTMTENASILQRTKKLLKRFSAKSADSAKSDAIRQKISEQRKNVEQWKSGERYSEYYEREMDAVAEVYEEAFHNIDRTYQLEYLKAHGLKPELSLLDYGCGPLGAGIHFIRYLDHGCYVGADISKKFLELGQGWIEKYGLADKGARTFHIPAGDLSPLHGLKFDFVWAQSVITHMPGEDVNYLLSQIGGLMKPEGAFLATFLFPTGEEIAGGVQREGERTWIYGRDFLEQMAARHGLRVRILEDFHHPQEGRKADRKIAVMEVRHA